MDEDDYEEDFEEEGEGDEEPGTSMSAPAAAAPEAEPTPAPAPPAATAAPAAAPAAAALSASGQAASSAAPKGLPSLPARPKPAAAAAGPSAPAAEPSSSSAAAAAAPAEPTPAAKPAAMPQLPARPGPVGLPGLPARPGLGGSSLGAPPAPKQQQAPPAPAAQTPAVSAPVTTAAAAGAGTGALPARPAGGLTGLPARPAPPTAAPAGSGAAGAGPSLPSWPATSAAGPSLPGRPAATPSLPARPAAAAPPASAAAAAAQPRLPARPAAVPATPAAAVPAAAVRPVSAAQTQAAAALAAAPPPATDVVDAGDTRAAQRTQRKIQDARVKLIRAAGRLGLRYDSEQVTQFLQVIERVERMHAASNYRGTRHIDLARAAEREARELDNRQAADSKLDIKVKVMLIGMTGTGKSEFINAMLERRAAATNAYHDTTKRIRVVKGNHHGIQMEFIDTPGLHASNTMHSANKVLLRQIKAAYKWHKPNYVFYVDRLDAARPSLGELTILSLINDALGPKVWSETMLILTHAHACRANMGAGYEQYSRQRRSIMMQLVRQAAGNNMVRNPMHLVDSHPNCPTNSFGQPVILDGGNNVPWKQNVFMQLVGYRLFEEVQALVKDKAKPKAAGAAAPSQQDLFRQLMRPRLPAVHFFVEQMAEGVIKPETWAAIDDPFDQETDDEAAEEYSHMYYQVMYKLAKQGHPWAQKEYDLMLKKMQKLRKTYKEVFENEDLEMMAGSGYEGYVTDGLDLGITFDPEDNTNHRYAYYVEETDWQVMPTLDYYGFEHEDAITGFVAEYDAQIFNRDGWGGLPFDIHLAVEKDKTSTCIMGESHLSVVHCVPPFGKRHISQLTGSFEYLRPNMKDILYQLEINTFRDGLLARKDHAGCGVMLARLGEGGKLGKGPVGVGLRLQDTLRVGAFKVEACAAKVQTDAAGGGKEEAWGGRAFVRYDYLPGLGMLFDFYQHRTKENEQQLGGYASCFTYDFEVLGAACGMEVDYVAGSDALYVDIKAFSCRDYRLAWLLVLPAWNWLKGTFQKIRFGGGEGEEVVEDDEVVEEEDGAVMYA